MYFYFAENKDTQVVLYLYIAYVTIKSRKLGGCRVIFS
jgi:hypothetical protein